MSTETDARVTFLADGGAHRRGGWGEEAAGNGKEEKPAVGAKGGKSVTGGFVVLDLDAHRRVTQKSWATNADNSWNACGTR